MKIIRYLAPLNGHPEVGILVGQSIYEIPAVCGNPIPLLLLDSRGLENISEQAITKHEISDVKLLSPVSKPRKIFALAANYHPHDKWLDIDVDVETPTVFSKPITAIIGPDETIPYHAIATRVVEEIELGVVIGNPGRNIPVSKAFEHVFGYTIMNDVSARSLGFSELRKDTPSKHWFDWLNGKWLDGYCPVGPWIVHKSDIENPNDLEITTSVNNTIKVQGTTKRMKFDIQKQIAYLSNICTLETGDLIATGVVPLREGQDETMLNPGDQIEGAIDGIGILKNTFGYPS